MKKEMKSYKLIKKKNPRSFRKIVEKKDSSKK